MHIKHNKITKIVLYPLILTGEWMGKHFPLQYMKIRYFSRFHRFVNLRNPVDLNEKILWLYFNTNTTEWSRLTDKLLVRDYVVDNGYEKKLKKVYAIWNTVEEVDFSTLPDSFVLKCNNGSGRLMVIKDKSKISSSKVLKEMKNWMTKDDFGYEYHYRIIKNKLFAEEYVELTGFNSVADYKFWCFNGVPSYVWVCTNRDSTGAYTMIYDMCWNPCPQYLNANAFYKLDIVRPKPSQFEYMKEMAAALSKSFPVVRVDLIEADDNVYFGEMTFTSVGGLNSMYSKEFLQKTGSLITL